MPTKAPKGHGESRSRRKDEKKSSKQHDEYAGGTSKNRNSKGSSRNKQPPPPPQHQEEENASDESSAFSDSSSDLGDGFSSSSEEFEDSTSSEDDFDEMPSHDDSEPPSLNRPVRRIQGVRFRDYYDISGKLGDGDFSKVFLGIHRSSGQDYAIKQILRRKMMWEKRNIFEEEIATLKAVRDGPSITQLYDVYEEDEQAYLVLEFMRGGELFDRIMDMPDFTEKDARDCTRCMLEALSFMHERRIAHRDLKPENLLLISDEDARLMIKVCDFGFAKKCSSVNCLRTLCGTPGYMAPEILELYPAYDCPSDIWSVGCILFLLLGSYFPFDDEDTSEDQVFERTRNGTYNFYPEFWSTISKGAKDLVSMMLTVNPNKRISPDAALQHEWINMRDSALDKKELNIEKLQESVIFARDRQDEQNRKMQGEEHRLTLLRDQFDSYINGTGKTKTRVASNQHRKEKPVEKFVEDSVTGRPFDDFYDVGEMLGEGGYACVFQATHKTRGVTYAVKDVDLTMLEEGGEATLKDEIWALKLLRGGPHIVRLYDVFEEPDHVYLVMEEMKGGDLLTRIGDKEVYTEREARRVCRIIFQAMDYIHKKKIAHRDIKPENVLLVEQGDDTSIKIADFGFAKKVPRPNCLRTLCGTAQYVAPEVLELKDTGYDTRADMWSVGVVVYILLGGYAPFEGPVDLLAQAIISGEYEFHEKYWDEISTDAKDMISNLLQVDPEIRLTADDALQCPYMILEDEALNTKDLSGAQRALKSKAEQPGHEGGAAVGGMGGKIGSLGAEFTTSLVNFIDIETRQKLTTAAQPFAPIAEEQEVEIIEDSSSGKPFETLYKWGREIGSGQYTVVHEAKHRQSREIYAVKRVARTDLGPNDAVALQDEITALQMVAGCPQIVTLHDVFEEPDYTFLVLGCMRGGDLIERITQKQHYAEPEARIIAKQLLLGVEYMHSKRIANRNLKPENILLTRANSDTDVKISDFGFAKRVSHPYSLRTQCGTEGYVAPEILEHRPAYDVQCDMWSLGVVLYIMLGGYRPFRGEPREMIKQIRYGEYKFHKRYWKDISDDVKHLITRMLTVNPALRITATLALQSDWILDEGEDEEEYSDEEE